MGLGLFNPRSWFAKPATAPPSHRMIRARFDSQFTTDDNRRHWAAADAMSADAAASPGVRRILRMRGRYEVANNSYARGICNTVANYVIGTGPRLQMKTGVKSIDDTVESLFSEWAKEINLGQTLHTSRVTRMESGEGFMLLRSNPGLQSPVKLDVKLIEADQVASPLFGIYPQQFPDQYFDGIVFDRYGNRTEYHVLQQHPGAVGAFVALAYQYDRWPARYVCHDYRVDRPGQQRGIPEITPALPLFANLRRYTLATVAAAETAADFAVMMKSPAPADGSSATDTGPRPAALDTLEIEKRMAMFLPEGFEPFQMKAEQPTTSYENFTYALLREICRCLDLPVIFASLDAEKANMSSAYVVTQPFIKRVQVDRAGYERHLDCIFAEFLGEAVKAGQLPADMPATSAPHQWFWPSVGNHADPSKVASARAEALASGATNLPREYAKEGLDWEAELASDAKSLGIDVKELQGLIIQKRFGLTPAIGQPGATAKPPASPAPDTEAADDDDENTTEE